MENLCYNISQVLGITVVHSLWQGLIIYMLLRIFILVFPKVPAAVRYRVAFGALTTVLAWFLYTLFLQLINYEWQSNTPVTINPAMLPVLPAGYAQAPVNKYYLTIAGYMPYVTVLYVVGLVFNTLKLAFAWNNIYQIRKYVTQTEFSQSIRRLSAQLNIKTKVEAAFSEWVDVPCVTGFLKPIILLPVSLSCYLNTEEVEAILLHELAHVKRNDYLHNFIQQVISVMLFFNPFARLICKVISEEREHSCDDLVIETTSRPFIYAQTLLKLEENKQYQWQLALAATGKRKFELLNRIERIMKTKKHTINIRPVLVTVLALTFGITSIAWLNPKVEDGKLKVKNLDPALHALSAFASGGDIGSAEKSAQENAATVKPKKHTVKVVYSDTILSRLSDTISKPGKFRIIIVDDKGIQKEYTSAADLPAEVRQELNARDFNFRYKFRGDSALARMNTYFESEDWKKHQADIEKNAEEMAKRFNSPEWKKQQKEIEKQAIAMSKKFESKDWKKQQAAMEKQAEEMAKKFNSPEWKKQQEDIEKSAEDMAKYFDSPEWKNTQDDFVKNTVELSMRALELGSSTANAELKKQQKAAQEQGMKVAEITKKMVTSPEWRNQQKEIAQKASEIAKKFKNSADYKKAIKDLKDALKKIPELREVPEAPEAPEAPEQPEAKEAPEAKSAPVVPAVKPAPVTPAKSL
ncbi:M56 family metallopeptidase [Mucilaginibacter auburnensis]|uniref:Beta-lactamase regulating signal transducer with metallopeptidase domain n=1 Tax=Mucilaginibacter auburnensis TaxID=1457233 RepID=A0A2H9VS60_9SPHI|nr:M56 family metallopeptidase [Mucilaginibacter auburnensis]PJJ83650.1 beta-lactamase regulating signal transducer with metallopeptidase domain [Mucilaginibacter auburnensis]